MVNHRLEVCVQRCTTHLNLILQTVPKVPCVTDVWSIPLPTLQTHAKMQINEQLALKDVLLVSTYPSLHPALHLIPQQHFCNDEGKQLVRENIFGKKILIFWEIYKKPMHILLIYDREANGTHTCCLLVWYKDLTQAVVHLPA